MFTNDQPFIYVNDIHGRIRTLADLLYRDWDQAGVTAHIDSRHS